MTKKKLDLSDIFNIAGCSIGSLYFGHQAITTPDKLLTITGTIGATIGITWLFDRFARSSKDNTKSTSIDASIEVSDPNVLDDFMMFEKK